MTPCVGGLCFAHHLNLLTKCLTFVFQDHLKKINGTSLQLFESHLAEIVWRNHHGGNILGPYFELIKRCFPCHTPPLGEIIPIPLFDSWEIRNNVEYEEKNSVLRVDEGEEWLDIDDSEWEPSGAQTHAIPPSHADPDTPQPSNTQSNTPQPRHADPDTPQPSDTHPHTPLPSNTLSNTPPSLHAHTHTEQLSSPHIQTPHTSTPPYKRRKRSTPPAKKRRTHKRCNSSPIPIRPGVMEALMDNTITHTHTLPTHSTHHPYTHSTPHSNFTPVVEVHLVPEQESMSPPALTPQASNMTPIATPLVQTQPPVLTPEVRMATLNVEALPPPGVASPQLPKTQKNTDKCKHHKKRKNIKHCRQFEGSDDSDFA